MSAKNIEIEAPEPKKAKPDKPATKKLPQSFLNGNPSSSFSHIEDIILPKLKSLSRNVKDNNSRKILLIFRKLKTYRKIISSVHIAEIWMTFLDG